LARIAGDERGTVLFEAGNRVAGTLRDLAEACGGQRVGAVCRELTKLHEEIVRGSLGDLAARSIDQRGEVVIVVGAGDPVRGSGPGRAERDVAAARTEVERRVAAGEGRGAAARAVSAATGIPRRALYDVGSVSSKRPTSVA
jgi:16S rRNA (cytidine1402-2'-O)-methyltransferase